MFYGSFVVIPVALEAVVFFLAYITELMLGGFVGIGAGWTYLEPTPLISILKSQTFA